MCCIDFKKLILCLNIFPPQIGIIEQKQSTIKQKERQAGNEGKDIQEEEEGTIKTLGSNNRGRQAGISQAYVYLINIR